jgi:hypothetical protein
MQGSSSRIRPTLARFCAQARSVEFLEQISSSSIPRVMTSRSSCRIYETGGACWTMAREIGIASTTRLFLEQQLQQDSSAVAPRDFQKPRRSLTITSLPNIRSFSTSIPCLTRFVPTVDRDNYCPVICVDQEAN